MRKCYIIIASYLSLIQACFSVSFMDIADAEKDPQIHRNYLARYIGEIYKSRVAYLEGRIDELCTTSSSLKSLGTTSSGLHLLECDQGNSEGSSYRDSYISVYRSDLAFWKQDPFTILVDNNPLQLDPSRDLELSLLFYSFVGTLSESFQKTRSSKIDTRAKSPTHQMFMEPLIIDGDYMMADLVRIIRAIRPHLRNQSTHPRVQAGQDLLKAIALRDAVYQWRDLTLDPVIRDEFAKHFNPNGTLKPIPLEEGVKAEQKESPVSLERESPSVLEKQKEEPKPKNVPPVLTGSSSVVKEREPEVTAPQVRREKVKTRPSPKQQELNKLFDDTPAWKKAKMNLDGEGSSSQVKEGEETLPSVTLKESKIKILRKLLDPKAGAVNVEKTLGFLAELGFVESTASQHVELKIKPTAIWLNGERILIDAAPTENIALAHGTGKKKYFKPWALQRLRGVLEAAGFKKLLE